MTTRLETNRQAIQQLWDQGIRDAKEIQKQTGISISRNYPGLDFETHRYIYSVGQKKPEFLL